MRVPLGNDEWCLCDSSEPPDHECMQFEGNETIALRWASQFHGDLFAQRTMRRLLGSTIPPRSDEQVAREVAWRLARGVWTAHRPGIEIPTADRGVPQEAPVAFPQQERRQAPPRDSTPPPEAPLFPSDIDALAIAEAQKRAAADGVPFCEECLRAQMSMAR
jgi:hypothetical protein